MQLKETYDLPPPALSGSGSKGTSQLCSAPGDGGVSRLWLWGQTVWRDVKKSAYVSLPSLNASSVWTVDIHP